jgi:WD40 repeat protein
MEKVYAAAFSADGTRVVTVSGDWTKVWELATGRLLTTLEGHRGWVYNAVFSPDGTRVVTASGDKTAKVWELATGRLLVSLEGHTEEVTAAVFSPDGTRVVTASGDKTARVWEIATGRLLASLEEHTGAVTAAAFSSDGIRVVTVSADNTAKVWDVSLETRSPDEIAALIRCYVSYQLDEKGRLLPVIPDPAACLPQTAIQEGWLGIQMERSDNPSGILVERVFTDSPATQGGIQKGDLIMRLGGRHVQDTKAFVEMVTSMSPDTTLDIEILRDGQTHTLQVTLGQRPIWIQ